MPHVASGYHIRQYRSKNFSRKFCWIILIYKIRLLRTNDILHSVQHIKMFNNIIYNNMLFICYIILTQYIYNYGKDLEQSFSKCEIE